MSVIDYITTNDPVIEGAILMKMIVSKKIVPNIKADFFTSLRKPLADAIFEQFSKYGTLDRGVLIDAHSQAYEQCANIDPDASPIVLDKLYKMWMIREAASLLANVALTENNVETTIQEIQLKLSDIKHKNNADQYNHVVEVNKIIEIIEAGQKSKRKLLGYSTGIDVVDRYSNGLEKGKLYTIGALKKGGKSRFGLYLSCMLHAQGAKIFWNSLEMSRTQLNLLATSYYSTIDSAQLGNELRYEDFKLLADGFVDLKNLDWLIYKDHTVSELQSRLLSLQKLPDVVIVDFYQRMQSTKYRNNRAQELDNVAQDLADLTRDLNICMIVFSQLQGRAEDLEDGEIPDMRHFKESQGIVENADQIWTLHRPNRHKSPLDCNNNYHPEEINMRVEQRYGISGAICKFMGDMRICKYSNIIEKDKDEYKDFRN